MAKDYRCPNCGSENTRSVPLVYEEGHYSGSQVAKEVIGQTIQMETTTYADGHKETREVGRSPIHGDVKRSAEGTTDLASKLKPPLKPTRAKRIDKHLVCGGVLTAGCTSIGCVTPLLLLAVYFGGSYFFPETEIDWTIVKYVIIAIVVVSIFRGYRKGKQEEKHDDEARALYEQRFDNSWKNYQQKKSDWEHSYICMRCGHVFVLDEDGASREYTNEPSNPQR